MSILQNSNAISAGGAYNITDSLRFRSSANASLYRDLSVSSNRKTWTWSGWHKRGEIAKLQILFGARNDGGGSDYTLLYFTSDARLIWNTVSSGWLQSNAVYRDASAWYHIVLSVDTTQAIDTDRVKIWVNGELVTFDPASTGTYPTQNTDTHINNSAVTQRLGIQYLDMTANQWLDGYLAEVNFVDGQALTPSYFGSTNADGVWSPKKYTGTYGTNGFYLPFRETTQATGFNTVLWKGVNGTNKVDNVGFQPDLVWLKSRDNTYSHYLYDSVRGGGQRLRLPNTDAEIYASGVTSFDSNGFSLGTAAGEDGTDLNYVAWCWDAGSADTLTGVGEFDGTGDYLSAPASEYTNYINGTSDFTIEWWVNYDALPASGFGAGWYAQDSGASVVSPFNLVQGGNNWYLWATTANGAWNIYNQYTLATTSLTTNRWYHIACVRNNGTLTLYVDGVAAGNDGGTIGSSNIWQDTSHNLSLFSRWQSQGSVGGIDGTISNYRIVKGTAVYTGNFTPPTAPLEVIANTKLLTCNRPTTFADESGNITITANGNAVTSQQDIFIENNNTDGTITSTVRANPDSGFSIVTWTGTGATATVGHGLSSAPNMIIIKNRTDAAGWIVYNSTIGNTNYLSLNSTVASSADGGVYWNATSPTSSVFTVNTSNSVNGSSDGMVAYCFSEVSGYSKFGSYTGNGSTSGPTVTTGFRPAFVMVKRTDTAGSWYIQDNTRDPDDDNNNLVLYPDLSNAEGDWSVAHDGLKITDTGFQWLNGVADVNASGSTYIYMAFADTRDYQWNFDASGNKNNWTPVNINSNASSDPTYDLMSDVPSLADEDTANFATWNPLSETSNLSTSEANLAVANSVVEANHRMIRATHGMTSGKYYWEVHVNNSSNVDIVGISSIDYNGTDGTYVGGHLASAGYGYNTSTGNWYRSGFNLGSVTTPPPHPANGIIGVAFDADSGKLYFHNNGTWINSADPVAGTNANFTASTVQSGYLPAISVYNNTGIWRINFGQKPFTYTPPTGYLKLNTFNLPDSSITDGSQYFDTVTWTGDGATSRNITGLEFSPDLVWTKERDIAIDHLLYDTIRGASTSSVSNALCSNTTVAEGSQNDNTTYGYLDGFNSDGFSVVRGSAGSTSYTNKSGGTYVAWNWRGSDSAPVSNTAGTITSTVSANPTAGFAIATYTGTGNIDTVGHGLTVEPDFIIVKDRDAATSWIVYTKIIDGSNDALFLDTTAAKGDSGFSGATSTVFNFSVGASSYSNTTGRNYVMYSFASIEGYSKIGSYTGNGSADGPFVYTGFKPAFVLFKRSDSTGNWYIFDVERNTYNLTNLTLFPNLSNAESLETNNVIDILSNGFKHRATGAFSNASGGTYIYMAFAENPFKNSLAR